jgi:NACalpha-BTF3-like transcription factor
MEHIVITTSTDLLKAGKNAEDFLKKVFQYVVNINKHDDENLDKYHEDFIATTNKFFEAVKKKKLTNENNEFVEEVDQHGNKLDEDEIHTIMSQADCSRSKAVIALKKHGNIVDAILELQD